MRQIRLQRSRSDSQRQKSAEAHGCGILSEHGEHDGRRKETVRATCLLKLKALLLHMVQNGLSATPTSRGGAARHPYVSAVPHSTRTVDQHASTALRARTHQCDYPELLPSMVTNIPEPGGTGNSSVSLLSVAGVGRSSSSNGGFAATPGAQERSAHA
jgi:hypothetical protein